MELFITTHVKLAAAAGITAPYLSAIKAGKGLSPDLAQRLADITTIPKDTWLTANSSPTQLRYDLKRFFQKELQREWEYLRKKYV